MIGTNRYIGSPVERIEDLRFLRGRGEFVRDLPGLMDTPRLIFFDCFSKRAHLRRPGGANPLDPSADQGSVDRQDHGRESCVSRDARAGPYARRAGGLARARAHALPEGKCEPGPQLHGVNTAEENHRLSFNCRLASMSVVDGSSGVVLSIKNS